MSINILVNIEDTTGGDSSGSMANVPGLSASSITVQGTGSVCLIIATVAVLPETDSTAVYQLAVNGSATNSPQITAFADSTSDEETNCPTLCWAVTGLSGASNTFAVQWQTVTGGPSKSTSRISSLLVLEITADAAIEYESAVATSANPGATFTDLFSSGSITIDGTGSVILLFGNVQIASGGDYSIDFQFSVDGTEEGAITCCDGDSSNEMSGWSGIHVVTGLSAGTHTFELAYRDRLGTPALSTSHTRTFQVIQISSGATLKSSIISAGAYTGASSAWSDDPNLDASVTVGSAASVMLQIANISMLGSSPDDTCAFRLEMDGAQVGADVTQFVDFADGGTRTLLAAAKTGMSSGSHDFCLGWYEIAADSHADTDRPRSQFVIEFTGIAYHLAGVTKDKDGNTKASCICHLWKYNSGTPYWLAYALSDGSGNYDFTGLGNDDSDYYVVSFKADSPHVMDITDHVLQPIEE